MEREDVEELASIVDYARRIYDTETMAMEMAKASDRLWSWYKGKKIDPAKVIFFQQRDVLLWQGMKYMAEGRPELALFYMGCKSSFDDLAPDKYHDRMHILRGMAHVKAAQRPETKGGLYEQWLGSHPDAVRGKEAHVARAQGLLERWTVAHPEDENALFYLGITRYYLEDFQGAFDTYLRAAELRHIFPEALCNVALCLKKLGKGDVAKRLLAVPEHMRRAFDEDRVIDGIELPPLKAAANNYLDIPIFILARDRMAGLTKMVYWLLRAGYHDIRILDDDSTYPPLLEYYDRIGAMPYVQVIRRGGENGSAVLWETELLNDLPPETPYVVASSEAIPDEKCPQDIVRRLCLELDNYPFLEKIGPVLRTDDVNDTDPNIVKEKQAYLACQFVSPKDGAYFAPVENTFALYRGICHHYAVRLSLRIGSPYLLRNLPWYYDQQHLPEDVRYYYDHLRRSQAEAKAREYERKRRDLKKKEEEQAKFQMLMQMPQNRNKSQKEVMDRMARMDKLRENLDSIKKL